MTAQASPVQVIDVDLELPLPKLSADGNYKSAWVVLRRNGVPQCMTMVDLTLGSTVVQNHLERIAAQVKNTETEMGDRKSISEDELPRISVVIPTIVTRIEELGHCINAIGDLDYPNFEVILVDNRRAILKRDPLSDLVADRRWLRVIRETRPGVSAARNAGISNAEGEVIAFTDDDVRVDKNWLRAIGTRMALNPQLDAVSGLILPGELETPAQIWFERYYGGFSGQRTFAPVTITTRASRYRVLNGSRISVKDSTGEEVRHLSILSVGGYGAGANMAFRKSTFERIGGFEFVLGVGTPARGGEDLAAMVAVLWSGGEIGYEPAAFVHHRHRREYEELLAQLEGYGLGFTAVLTSLVKNNPEHSLAIVSQLPEVLKWKIVQAIERVRGRKGDGMTEEAARPLYPFALFAREFRAFFFGPHAYSRSKRKWQTLTALEEDPEH
jgi:hypothetical protein